MYIIIRTIAVSVIATAVLTLFLIAAFMTGAAQSHDADSGWRYPARPRAF